MKIRAATTDSAISACYALMRELRPEVPEDQFLSRVRAQETMGYRLACLEGPDGLVAVAGFRVGESFAWGRFLYVDDLVVRSGHRSKGHGTALLSWLKAEAVRRGCGQLHLDSGLQRKDAHRFYERQGLLSAGFHFVADVSP